MKGYEQGIIKGLYNLIYERQHIVKEILSDYFMLPTEKINIRLRSTDLAVVVYADILTARRQESFNLLIVNRLDEYIYNFDDVSLLFDFKRIIKNQNRLTLIKKLIKKSGRK